MRTNTNASLDGAGEAIDEAVAGAFAREAVKVVIPVHDRLPVKAR